MPPFRRTESRDHGAFATSSRQGSAQIQATVMPFGNQRGFRSPPNRALTPGPALNTVVYQGFKFIQACPGPGQTATWRRAERTEMYLGRNEFYKMVDERASGISPSQQYETLSKTCRDHADQLVHEQRLSDPNVEWSCVYAKENKRPAKARNTHRGDCETVSMVIILMKRPIKTKPYPRTPMGEVVDLGTLSSSHGPGITRRVNQPSSINLSTSPP